MTVGFNVENFRAVMNETGIMRPSKFICRFNMPRGMIDTANYTDNKALIRRLEFLAEAVTLPMTGIAAYQAQRYGYGPQTKRPTGVNFMDISVMFIGDRQGRIFQFFVDWFNMIYNYNMIQSISSVSGEVNSGVQLDQQSTIVGTEPYEVAYTLEYVTDLEIILFDLTGQPVKSIMLREAYPIAMQNIEFNWLDTNSYVKIPIAFTFTDYYINPILPAFPDQTGEERTGNSNTIVNEFVVA